MTKIWKYITQLLVVGMLLVAFLPAMPASAATPALGISITETMTKADTYTPSLPSGGSTATGPAAGAGVVTITDQLSSTDLYDVTITFAQGQTTNWRAVPAGAATVSMDGTTVTVHIPKVTQGTPVTLNYDVTSAATVPLTMSASYSANQVSAVNGASTDITFTLTKNEAGGMTTDISGVRAAVGNVMPGVWAFASSSPDTSVVGGSLVWDAGTITSAAPDNTKAITYTATVADADAFTSTDALHLYDMATATLEYAIGGGTVTAANVRVTGTPQAITQFVGTDIIKQYVPGTGYLFTPVVKNTNPEDVDFTLDAVNFWIVDSADPTSDPADTRSITGIGASIASGAQWSLSSPIAENVAYVPAGFIKPSLRISDSGGQITRTYTSENGNSITLLKQIYVLNGYLIEVTKTVTEQSGNPGHFDVSILVQNTGTRRSPDVYVYDIVPSAWYSAGTSPANMVPAATGSGAVTNPIAGQAYWWNVGQLDASASTTITYEMIGPSDYRLSDVFVIGIDPAQSTGLQTMPGLENAAVLATANFEMLAALGAAGLLLVGVVGTARRRL